MKFLEIPPKRLIDTKDMPKDEWLEHRRQGITGTDVAAIFEMDPYKTAYQCYLDKLGLIPEIEDNNYMRFGRDVEATVAKWFMEETGFMVEQRFAIYQHAKYKWMLANIDRWIVGQRAILECKTANYIHQRDHWGETGTDQVPEYYLFQVYHYMITFGVTTGYLAVIFTDTKGFRWYKFDLDEELAAAIIKKTHDFWFHNVIARIEPEIYTIDDLVRKYPRDDESALVADEITTNLCLQHEMLRQERKLIEDRQEELKVEIGKKLGNHRELLVNDDGKILAAFATPKPRTLINRQKLQSDYPDAANDCMYQTDPSRSVSFRWQTLQKIIN